MTAEIDKNDLVVLMPIMNGVESILYVWCVYPGTRHAVPQSSIMEAAQQFFYFSAVTVNPCNGRKLRRLWSSRSNYEKPLLLLVPITRDSLRLSTSRRGCDLRL